MIADVRILVVDDSRTMRESIVRILTNEKFIASEAIDGEDGLKKVLADPPDLILIDLEMPRMTGLEVVDALCDRQIEIPVILMTSHGSEALAVELFRKGVKNYLIKPFEADEVVSAIDQALTEVRLRRERDILTQNLVEANHELAHRVRELDTLYHIGKSVTSALSREQLLERIIEAVFYLTRVEEATILLVNAETGQLIPELHRQQIEGEIRRASQLSAKELVQRTAKTGKSMAADAMFATPLKKGDRIIGVLLAGNRVSDTPLAEHSHKLLLSLGDYAAIALENARLYENIRQANKSKSEFVSLVAHELKQPMTAIRGYADMLRKGVAGPITTTQEQFIDAIRSSAERMQLLITDLQDVSRVETGQLNLEIRIVDLKSILDIALREIRGQLESKSQTITTNILENLPQVKADPTRLMQIIANLLSNAHKYTQKEGHIHVRVFQQGEYLHCAVADDGIGMTEKTQAKLFTKFFRVEAPGMENVPGTGLGLCIVKSLVELQGGEIKIKSEAGKGSVFTFTVPIAPEK
ncbi:MAG: hypothetical protein B6I38_07230 [Anaerolineaceae bacterium 4572_5.1]|nr:MAG: hypothetical protein B6I38_07230 [Anaerolineaceae bacterium 4572_5.1]